MAELLLRGVSEETARRLEHRRTASTSTGAIAEFNPRRFAGAAEIDPRTA